MQLPDLSRGVLLRRYKRFLADVALDDGRTVTAHSANTGAMAGCSDPGSPVWLSRSDNPKRKHPYTWELVDVAAGVPVGINTVRANALVREGIEQGVITELQGYADIRGEVVYGQEGSRIDLLLEASERASCFVEVKNVTLVEDARAYFPDAVSSRGLKHLRELAGVVRTGDRGVLVFCVQRADVREVRPADHIDPQYGEGLREAMRAGVEVLAYRARVSIAEIVLETRLPVVCP